MVPGKGSCKRKETDRTVTANIQGAVMESFDTIGATPVVVCSLEGGNKWYLLLSTGGC